MNKFKNLGLSESIVKAVDLLGFTDPTPIQQQVIPHLLENENDLIALAQTGTGKTAAFGLPMLELIEQNSKYVQAIVLCPTRELCLQLAKDLESYAKFQSTKIVCVYGGTSIVNQIRQLEKGCQIVVGTPGRTLDLIKRKKLNISQVSYTVFDEADEMLSMGFKDDMDAILASTPDSKQTLLFSATMPKEVRTLANKYMKNCSEIQVGTKNETNANVEHIYYNVAARTKYQALKRLVDSHPEIYGIIFCRTRAQTKELAEKLTQDKYNSEAIHGELSQEQRDNVMRKFKNKQTQLLIATDVAARGIDVDSLTHVINYNLPDDPMTYVHRSGRTGRAGNKGESIVLLSGRDKSKLPIFERKIKTSFVNKQLPKVTDILESKIFVFAKKLAETEVNLDKIKGIEGGVHEIFKDLTKEDLVQKLLAQEFNQLFDYYDSEPEKMNQEKSRGRDRDQGGRRDSGRGKRGRSKVKFTKYYINIGKKHQVTPNTIFQLVNKFFPKKSVEVGNIQIKKAHSFFELDAAYDAKTQKIFNKGKYKGVSLYVEKTF